MRRNIAYHRLSWLILWECNTNIISENIQFGLYGPGKGELGVEGFCNRNGTGTGVKTINSNTQKIGKIVSMFYLL